MKLRDANLKIKKNSFTHPPSCILLSLSQNTSRSSRPEVFCKKDVLRNFAKFTGKHLCQSLFFNKVAGLRPATLLKKRLWHRSFHANFAKFLRTPILTQHLLWLLLYITITSSEEAVKMCEYNFFQEI